MQQEPTITVGSDDIASCVSIVVRISEALCVCARYSIVAVRRSSDLSRLANHVASAFRFAWRLVHSDCEG